MAGINVDYTIFYFSIVESVRSDHRLRMCSTSLPPLYSVLTGHQHTTLPQDGSLYPSHIPTNSVQKALLAVGSGVAALQNPYRHGNAFVINLHSIWVRSDCGFSLQLIFVWMESPYLSSERETCLMIKFHSLLKWLDSANSFSCSV